MLLALSGLTLAEACLGGNAVPKCTIDLADPPASRWNEVMKNHGEYLSQVYSEEVKKLAPVRDQVGEFLAAVQVKKQTRACTGTCGACA